MARTPHGSSICYGFLTFQSHRTPPIGERLGPQNASGAAGEVLVRRPWLHEHCPNQAPQRGALGRGRLFQWGGLVAGSGGGGSGGFVVLGKRWRGAEEGTLGGRPSFFEMGL